MLPPILADVNIAREVVEFLRIRGTDVVTVQEKGWAARTDDELLAEALRMARFVMTHDPDFGRLAIAEGQPYLGVLLLRPGHDPPQIVIAAIQPLLDREVDWTPPMVAVYQKGRLRIRRPRR